MKMNVIAAVSIVALFVIAPSAIAQTSYMQDFEGLSQTDGALSGDGWLVYGNIFDPAGNHIWGHGPWPAPNNQDPGNWCDIVDGQGGGAQEIQQLVVYSDYGNGEHANGNLVESNLFQEQVVPVGALGTWTFTFDAKMGDLAGASTALGFIKTLDPANGWATTNFIIADVTATPATWTDYSLSVDVAGLDGQILQFGFMSVATNYEPCGIYYAKVAFSHDGTVSHDSASWSDVKTLFR